MTFISMPRTGRCRSCGHDHGDGNGSRMEQKLSAYTDELEGRIAELEAQIAATHVVVQNETIGIMAKRIVQLEQIVEELCTFSNGWKLVYDASSVEAQAERPHGGSCSSCAHQETAPDGACRGCFDPPDSMSPRLTHWQERPAAVAAAAPVAVPPALDWASQGVLICGGCYMHPKECKCGIAPEDMADAAAAPAKSPLQSLIDTAPKSDDPQPRRSGSWNTIA